MVDILFPLLYPSGCWNAGKRTSGPRPATKQQVLLANLKKEDAVKKIALTMVAVATLGLAACTGGTEANNAAGNESETTNEANEDVGNAGDAENAANDALNTVVNAGSDVGNAASSAADAAGNVASDAGNAVSNATR
jgi:hypothetical protein